jgi:hypothetical protein
MNKQIKTISQILIFIFVVLGIIELRFFNKKRSEEFRKYGTFGTARIYDVNPNINKGSSGYNFDYEYKVNNKIYKGHSSSSGINYRLSRMILDKTFPIIYLSIDPEVARILVTPYDFRMENRDYPDSLKWIKKEMEN